MANEQNNGGQLQIELTPEVAGGTYSNLAMIAHGPTEFVLDFCCILPGMPKAKVQDRVVMAPEHAKRLLFALQENVARYENTFGKIEFPEPKPQSGRTIAPFGTTGEA